MHKISKPSVGGVLRRLLVCDSDAVIAAMDAEELNDATDWGASARAEMKSEPDPPMTLGNAAAAQVWLIVWCWDWDPRERARSHLGNRDNPTV